MGDGAYIYILLLAAAGSRGPAQAIEEGEDIEALAEQNRRKVRSRATESGAVTPVPSDGRGRGRKGKNKVAVLAAVAVGEDEGTPVVAGKRKRGLKSMSVTPSLQGDEEEEVPRETVSVPRRRDARWAAG
jgi:hypothetical protein